MATTFFKKLKRTAFEITYLDGLDGYKLTYKDVDVVTVNVLYNEGIAGVNKRQQCEWLALDRINNLMLGKGNEGELEILERL